MGLYSKVLLLEGYFRLRFAGLIFGRAYYYSCLFYIFFGGEGEGGLLWQFYGT